jgi:small nuclear ribonucleoprotein (snRNP)-like protein
MDDQRAGSLPGATLLAPAASARTIDAVTMGLLPSIDSLASTSEAQRANAAATTLVPDIAVRVLLHNGQLIQGTFVAFDHTMSHVLCDCVELHPHAGCHVPGPLVFPRVVIAYQALETLLSPSLTSDFVKAPPLALFAHPVASSPSHPPTD